MAVQALTCSRLNPVGVLCTICKFLLNNIWCLLTENTALNSCWLPTTSIMRTRFFGSISWSNSQANKIVEPGKAKFWTLRYLRLPLSVPSAVNFLLIQPHVFLNPHVRCWATEISLHKSHTPSIPTTWHEILKVYQNSTFNLILFHLYSQVLCYNLSILVVKTTKVLIS